ncbi:hypothetical protein GGF32_007230 [Allomyces javanicus]|nr:hypothetical protein GGF32_007230 [Allomyces javanicus]
MPPLPALPGTANAPDRLERAAAERPLILSPDNAARAAINYALVRAAKDQNPLLDVFCLPADISELPKQSNKLTIAQKQALYRLPEAKTERVPAVQYAYIGMPIRILSNMSVPRGIANGTVGKVFAIDFEPGTTFVDTGDGFSTTPSRQPRNIFAKFDGLPPGPRFPGLPND